MGASGLGALTLVPVVGIGSVHRVGACCGNSQFERAEMAFMENIGVSVPSEKNVAQFDREFDVPGEELRVHVRRVNTFNFEYLDYADRQETSIQNFADLHIHREDAFWADSPLKGFNNTRRPTVVLDGDCAQSRLSRYVDWSAAGDVGTFVRSGHFLLATAHLPSDNPKTNSGKRKHNSEIGNNPVRVTEVFEYAGKTFQKEYVERGAVIAIGIVSSVIFWIYYARRNVGSEPTHRLH